MAASDESRGMPAPLPHGARRGDAHRPEQESLAALGARDQSVGTENAAHAPVEPHHRAQLVVGAKRVPHDAVDALHDVYLAYVVRGGIDAHHGPAAVGDARQPGGNERPLLLRIGRRPLVRPRRREELVITAAWMDRVVNQGLAVRGQRHAPYEAVQPSAEQVESTVLRPFRKPYRIDELE